MQDICLEGRLGLTRSCEKFDPEWLLLLDICYMVD
jgi:hypothetical protein